MHNYCSNDYIHINSTIASAIALYSALVLDHDTIFCFFEHQDIKLGPKKKANPLVDFLSSEQPTQLASEKVLIRVDEDRRICSPKLLVYLRNLRILFTTVQCIVVGE
jgi:hypothetical protein